ncbi:MAG: hypothetical protein PHS49_07590, partial [Candidatus Gracilibacteria bacterium]|nr:hypothetical protein [Candidatus Gracilibacteria bacterium]
MKKILIILLVLIFSSYKSFALSEMDNNTCRLVGENYTTQDSYNLIKVNKDSSYYYVKDNNGKKVVVYVDTNGIQTESKIEFDRIDNMINSPLGTSIAYYGEISGKFILIVNSKIYSNFKEIKDFKFSPDGKNFLFKSNDDYGNEIIIKDGSVFVDNIFKSIDTIYFSEDGKHIFYFAEKTLKYEIDNEIENEANDLLDEFLISYDNFNNNNYTSDNSSKVNNDLANN